MNRVALNIKRFLGAQRTAIANNRQAVRSVAAALSGNMAASLLGAVGGILVARFVAPDVAGQFRSYTIPLMYLTFLHLGTPDGLNRQLPYYSAKDQPEKVEALASTAGAWNIFISILISVGFILCAFYSLWKGDTQGIFGWLSQALCCWGIFFGVYVGATYRTVNHFAAFARIQIFQSLLAFCIVFTMPFSQFYGLCVRAAVPTILGLLLLQHFRPLKVKYRFQYKELKSLVRTGAPFFFWIYISTSLWIASESFLILRMGGLTALGLFGVAVVIRDALSILPMSIHQVVMPKTVEKYAIDGNITMVSKKLFQITIVTTAVMIAATLLCSAILTMFVPIFIPKYAAGLPLMKLCLWFAAIHAASFPLNALFSTGNAWLYGRGVLLGIAFFPVAVWLCLPLVGGVMAVVIGSLVGRIVRVLESYVEIWLLLRRAPVQ